MNILFVCTGNTCRSPMAEGYLDSLNIDGVEVRSCGIAADGSPVSENSAAALGEIGIDISDHISCQLEMSDIAWADKILCMSLSHKTALSFYTNPQKLYVLGEGIPDPFGGDIKIYRECRDSITAAIDKLYSEDFFGETQVVKACKTHLSKIAELEKECFSQPWNENMLLESYENGTHFFVALRNGVVAGYIGVSCILDEGYITNVAVFPKYRRKGVATALLNRVFSLGSDEALSFVTLEVRASNQNAISLYERLGFKLEGRRKNFYESPREDALIMTKRF